MTFMKKIISEIKKKIILFLLCIGIIFSCWYSLLEHYKNFSQKETLISKIENKILDLKFLIRGIKKPNAKIGILAIDEKAIDQFGRWPFSRKYYEKSFQNLKNLGVKWIGMDAVFSEKEVPNLSDIRPSLDEIKESFKQTNEIKDLEEKIENKISLINQMEKLAPGDLLFSKAVKEFENIVLGFFYFQSKEEVKLAGYEKRPFHGFSLIEPSAIEMVMIPEEKKLEDYSDGIKVQGFIGNIEEISASSQHFAFFSNQPDEDAIIRWVTQVRIVNGKMFPSLSLKLAAEALKRDIVVFMDNFGIEAIELVSRDNQDDTIKIPVDPLGLGRVIANHRGPSRSFQHFSLADAYNNSFTEEEKSYLKDSVLLLGSTAIGINDQRPNPFDPALDGVENHAAVTDNIMSQDFLQRPISIYNTEKWIIILIGLLFVPILLFSSASFSGFSALFFLTSYYYFDKYYWFSKGIWAYMGMPFIEIISLFIIVTIYKYMTEEKEKRKVKGAFAHYLSPDVINQVLSDPDSLQLGGVRKELTVFFSDVRGFTTISETLSPEQLCEFMNTYFTPMTSIILKSGGVLDKYIGDAIMAFWGAPMPFADQADRAVESSIQMLFALDKLQADFLKKGFPKCDIGIGLNTGPMSVGNMGSDERFCYTVMGDAVNLGSRLEGLTKEYGIKIIISEFTVKKLTKKSHFIRDLDDIRVKGKNEPVKVFDLIRPDLLKSEDKIKNLIGFFEEGRILYRQQDWMAAQKKFEECLKLYPDDGPSIAYLERISEYKTKSFIENWDGVYTFTHK